MGLDASHLGYQNSMLLPYTAYYRDNGNLGFSLSFLQSFAYLISLTAYYPQHFTCLVHRDIWAMPLKETSIGRVALDLLFT